MNQKAKFVRIPNTINRVGIQISNGHIVETQGAWPLLDESLDFMNIVAIGNKNGLDTNTDASIYWIREFFPKAKLIFNCQNGPYLIKNYKRICREFDGHMTLDFDRENKKSLYMSHSMMVRSMPKQDGFFWEPTLEKRWDFSILTIPFDNIAKHWDRCLGIIDILCGAGLSGLVVAQRGVFPAHPILEKYSAAGLLTLKVNMPEREFHQLQAMSKIGIFPNQTDAFPKHLIECVLSDKGIIISRDLLIGKSLLDSLWYDKAVDFDTNIGLEQCKNQVKNGEMYYGRRGWLTFYGFINIAFSWAWELNKKFETKAEMAFFLNHIDRIYLNIKKLTLSKPEFRWVRYKNPMAWIDWSRLEDLKCQQ